MFLDYNDIVLDTTLIEELPVSQYFDGTCNTACVGCLRGTYGKTEVEETKQTERMLNFHMEKIQDKD